MEKFIVLLTRFNTRAGCSLMHHLPLLSAVPGVSLHTSSSSFHLKSSRSISCKQLSSFHRTILKVRSSLQPLFMSRRYLADLPEYELIRLPALSPTMEMGTIVKWEKNEGDSVSEGDLLCEIETDKATMGFEASEDGFLAKIFLPEGSRDVPVGEPLCIVVQEQESVAAFADFEPPAEGDEPTTGAETLAEELKPEPIAAQPAEEIPPPHVQDAPLLLSPQLTSPAADGRMLATPLAKTLAKEMQIDLSLVSGTGPGGQVRGEDVKDFAATGTGQVAPQVGPPVVPPGAAYIDIPLSNMRKVIAKRLLESKQTIPHFYLTVDVNMEKVVRLRKALNEKLAGQGRKISVNDFLVKAAALACQRHPEANSQWMDSHVRQFARVDINIAVATDSGLITPIIFGADSKGLREISEISVDLATKAREKRLHPDEYQGGTFTISNLGMFGIEHFSAVINPPQVCILAASKAIKRVVPDDVSEGSFKVATLMNVTLSCDHRVVDGAVGAKWLAAFKDFLEEPETMLL